jgi:hypothetical protein
MVMIHERGDIALDAHEDVVCLSHGDEARTNAIRTMFQDISPFFPA